MYTLEDLKKEAFKNPEVKTEYEALGPEYALIQAIIDARRATGLTQKELAARTGISQSDISKFETGNGNPSLKTVERLAAGMGMRVKLEFVPADAG